MLLCLDVQKMGYGSKAIDLLLAYFEGRLTVETLDPTAGVFGGEGSKAWDKVHSDSALEGEGLLSEQLQPKAKLPPLLTPVADRPAERLHWLGVSFGLTSQLLNFWSKKRFKVCYLRQTANDLTGEHSSIMLRELDCSSMGDSAPSKGWLSSFVSDYRKRLISLMGYSFSRLESALAITLVDPDRRLTSNSSAADEEAPAAPKKIESSAAAAPGDVLPLTALELLTVHLSHHDMKRLELYSRNMVDHHMILDTLPTLARLVFQGRLPSLRLSYLQVAILLATGLQHRDVDSISAELDLPSNQVLAFFNKTIRKIATTLRELVENYTAKELLPSDESILRMEKRAQGMSSLAETLDSDQKSDEKKFVAEQQRALIMTSKDLNKHSIDHVNLKDLSSALDKGIKKQNAVPAMISVAKSKSGGSSNVLPALTAEELAQAMTSGKDKDLKRSHDQSEGNNDNGEERESKKKHKKKHKHDN